MSDLLFLSHRIPYPPDKGDKIRAWNILQHLAQNYRVHLATFIDDADDVCEVAHLESICQNVFWQKLDPKLATIRSLSCFLTGAPLTKGYFGDARFRAGVRQIIQQHKPRIIYVFSSAMLPYVTNKDGCRIILDLVDVDSEKWRQYAAASSGLARWIYAREGRTLLELEREGAGRAETVLLVSQPEAELFKALAPESSARVYAVPNGVDTEYFNPLLDFPNPLGHRPAIVFTGLMDYRPNIDAMTWFVREVMPRLRSRSNPPSLWIVGANPAKAVRVLAGDDVHVTGWVSDVRPYLRYASAVVAPLRIGRGIQNKVLEAMAMGAPLVVTPEARVGLENCGADELVTADNSADFADALAQILNGNFPNIGPRARKRVATDYRWSDSFGMLDQLLGMGFSPMSKRERG